MSKAKLKRCKTCNDTKQIGEEESLYGRSMGFEECSKCKPEATSDAVKILHNRYKPSEKDLAEAREELEKGDVVGLYNEKKQQVDFLNLAKEQMDAYAEEIKRLKHKIKELELENAIKKEASEKLFDQGANLLEENERLKEELTKLRSEIDRVHGQVTERKRLKEHGIEYK